MPTTKIQIQTGYDGTGSGAASVALGKVGDTATKAERQLAAYARTVAQSQRAMGDIPGSIRTYENALSQLNRTSKEAIAIERQLATVRKASLGPALPRTVESFGTQAVDQFKNGLIGVVGPAALVTTGIRLATAAAQEFAEAFKFKAELDATTLSINAQLRGVRDSAQVWDQASAFARKYKLTQGETTDAIAASVGVMRASKAPMEDILGVLARLQVLSPEQSLQEAAVALKALASGDTTSLVTRFEVGRDVAIQMKNEILAGGDAVAVMSKFLDNTGIGMDVLATKTMGAAGAIKDLALAQENLKLAQAEFAQGPGLLILQGQIRATSGLTRLLSGDFDAMGQSLQGAGVAFAASAAGYQAYMQALAEGKTAAEANSIAANAQADATARLTGVQRDGGGGSFEFATATNALTGAMSAESAAAAQLTAAQSAATAGLVEDITKKQTATAESEKLAAVQKTLAGLGDAVAGGFQTAASAATFLATRYGFAYGEALKLINAQAALANVAGDPMKGVTEGRSERTTTAGSRNDVRIALAEKAAEAAKAAAALGDVQFQNQLKKAKSNAAKIALLRQRAGATSDPIERARIEGQIIDLQSQKVAGLSKELSLQEANYDSINKQRQAKLDLVGLSIDNQRATTKEAQEAARLQAALDSGKQSGPRQEAIRLRLAEIQNDQAQRALKIEETQASAGGSIVNGKLLQSQPGAVPTALGPPTPVGGAPFASGAAAASPFNPAVAAPPVVVNIALNIVDGKLTSANAGGGLLNVILGSAQQTFASGG